MSLATPGLLDYSGRTPSFSQLFLLHRRWWHWKFQADASDKFGTFRHTIDDDFFFKPEALRQL